MKTGSPSRILATDAPDVAAVAHVRTAMTDTDNIIGRCNVYPACRPNAVLLLLVLTASAS